MKLFKITAINYNLPIFLIMKCVTLNNSLNISVPTSTVSNY